jgi:hypothetical protein
MGEIAHSSPAMAEMRRRWISTNLIIIHASRREEEKND